MKILLIHQYYMKDMNVPGGARWNEMTKVWAQQGHTITVIASMYCNATGRKHPEYKGKVVKCEKLDDGLEVIRVHTSERYDKSIIWRAWAYFTFVFFGFFGALCFAKGKYDIVLATSPPLTVGPLGIILRFFKRSKFVFEIRDLWPDGAINTGVVKNPMVIKLMFFMERISYNKANAINALTPAFKEILIKQKNISPEKIWMIPNAADLNIIKPGPIDSEIRQKHGWGDKFVGLYIGAHGKMNHLWQLIEAAKILRDDPEYLIACVGGGMERNSLIEKANNEGLTNIQFLPAVSKMEVAKYINSCDVSLIVLKKADIMKTVYPNKMFDAMSAEKPIILAIGGVSKKLVVEDAKSGIYVEPENADDIVEKMRYYKEHPGIAKQHGQNGYKFVCDNFDRHKLAERYAELLKTLLVNDQRR